MSQEEKDFIKEWLEENGLSFDVVDGMYVIPYESTIVIVRRAKWSDHDIVEITATVAIGVKDKPELLKFLLAKNAEIPLGKFSFVEEGLDGKPTVFYSHYMLEKYLEKEEFRASLAAVMAVADMFDEKIAELGEGSTSRDYILKAQEKGGE